MFRIKRQNNSCTCTVSAHSCFHSFTVKYT